MGPERGGEPTTMALAIRNHVNRGSPIANPQKTMLPRQILGADFLAENQPEQERPLEGAGESTAQKDVKEQSYRFIDNKRHSGFGFGNKPTVVRTKATVFSRQLERLAQSEAAGESAAQKDVKEQSYRSRSKQRDELDQAGKQSYRFCAGAPGAECHSESVGGLGTFPVERSHSVQNIRRVSGKWTEESDS